MPMPYDSWDSFDRENFNPDGTMTEDYRNRLMARGVSLAETWARENRKQEKVRQFEETEKMFQENYGISYAEWLRPTESNAQRNKRQRLALDEGADISELPEHIEPDEYYDKSAGYPG